MARLGGLGKGLDALIPSDAAPSATSTSGLREIPVGAITPNRHQPRVHFDEDSLADLAASISAVGVLQPVLVRPAGDGTYELIAGERRWRAATKAQLATIPAIVRVTDDLASVEQAVVENLHRQDLTALEEASAYQQLIDDFGLTHDAVATRVGKSRAAISNTLRLLQLPPGIQQLLADGRISAGHARALLGTGDRPFQEHLARRASDEGWSVRAVEDAVRMRERGPEPVSEVPEEHDDVPAARRPDAGAGRPQLRPPGLLELEELLAGHLDTRVSVTMTGKRGRIAIDFADLEDLERIYRRMTEASTSD